MSSRFGRVWGVGEQVEGTEGNFRDRVYVMEDEEEGREGSTILQESKCSV